MSSPSDCPDVRDLQRLLAGQVSAEEAGPLERHLADCESCREAARVLPQGGPLAETLNGCVAIDASSEANRAVPTHVRSANPPATGRDTAGNADPTPMRGSDSGAGSGRFEFLAPPQQAGEIGRLGPFRVLAGIGIGGMGVVFCAHDPLADRLVALKVMQPRLSAHEGHRQRFLREARVAAGLRHDHVVTIYQVGEDRGVLFLAMELLQGETLADRLRRQKRLEPAEAARIAREAALGLSAAHQRGLIHRDVKPANLWLDAGTGRVKVLDFGLALPSEDSDHLTGSGLLPGTVPYMAPEQARSRSSEVGPWTDVYGLGVVLYLMLSGRLPFEGPVLEVVHRIAEETPPPPSSLRADLDPALEAIVLKAMAPRPQDRYPNGQEMAEALGDWSSGRAKSALPIAVPVPAPPRSSWRVFALVLAAMLLVGGAWVAQTIIRVRDRDGKVVNEVVVPAGGRIEIVPDEKAPPSSATIRPRDSAVPAKPPTRSTGAARSIKEPAAQSPRPGPRLAEVPGLISVLGNPAWRHPTSGTGSGANLAMSDDKTVTVWWQHVWGEEHVLRVWDASTGVELPASPFRRPVNRSGREVPGYFDGKTAALFSGESDNWSWKLWDITGQREPVTLWARGPVNTCLAVSADGRIAAAGRVDGHVCIWDATTGDPLGDPLPVQPGAVVQRMAFQPKAGYTLAIALCQLDGDRETGIVRVWDAKTRKDIGTLMTPAIPRCDNLVFASDAATLAGHTARPPGTLQLWHVTAGRLRLSLEGPTSFALGGDTLACGGADGAIRQYNLDGQEVRQFRGHSRPVTALVFSSDSQWLASLSAEDGSVRLWHVPSSRQMSPPDRFLGPARFVALSRTGRIAAVGRGGSVLQLWDTVTGRSRGFLQIPEGQDFLSAAFSPDEKLLAASTTHGEVRIWDLAAGEWLVSLRGTEQTVGVGSVQFSPDGKTLACGGPYEVVRLWEVSAGRDGWKPWPVRPDLANHPAAGTAFLPLPGSVTAASSSVAFGSGGKRLAAVGDGTLRLWDLVSGSELVRSEPGRGPLRGLAFAGDGRRLACGTESGTLLLWEFSADGALRENSVKGTIGPIVAVAFAPDNTTVYAAGSDGQIARWVRMAGTQNWEKHATWQLPGPVYGMDLAADRRHAATANGDGTAYLLNLDLLGKPAPPK